MRVTILLFFWLSPLFVNGQRFIFNQIPTNDALPSKETYHVFQDNKGYVWIATELGLCRLDGEHVTIFDHKNGLPENAIYAVKQHKETIWMVSAANRILTLKNGQLREHPLSKAFQQAINSTDAPSYAINFIKNKVVINSKWQTIELDTIKGIINKIPIDDKNANLYLNKEGLIPYNSLFYRPVKYFQFHVALNDGRKKTVKLPYKGTWSYRFLSENINQNYFFSYNNQLVKIKPDLSVETYSLPADISCLYVDKDNDLWIGMQKKGLLYYPKGEIKTNAITALPNYSVVGIYQDREDNIWCTTLEKGVFMTKSKQVVDYANKLGPYYGKALMTPVKNGIAILKDFNLHVIDSNKNFNSYTIKEKLPKADKGIISLMSATQQYATHFSTLTQYDFVQDMNEDLYSVTYYHLNRIRKGILTNYTLPSKGRCVALLNDSSLLVGCNDGVYYFHTKNQQLTKLASTKAPVTSFLINSKNGILVATKGDGIFKLVNKKLIPFTPTSDIVYDIKEDRFNHIWLATSKGLMKLSDSKTPRLYTVLNGLPSNDIYKLAISNNLLYILSSEGLASIPLSYELLNQTPMPIYLKLAMAADTIPLDFKKPITLKHYQNAISLWFDRLSFKNNKNQLRYKLSPLDQHYQISKTNEISLKNLPPNNYQLTVYGINSDKVESKPIQLHFIIKKPFWQQWWFIILCITIIALIIYTIAHYSFKNIQRKETEKTRINKLIAESELKALQAQMNPHFIFNCINSIQKYILKKQEKEAYNYLAKFSQLIRMVLTHSQDKNITLHDELNLLALYISLEQMRFKNSFEYIINIEPNINSLETKIPSMLVQPYVENAIWHGLMYLDTKIKAILSLTVKMEDHQLLIMVKDNGIGRKKAMEYQKDYSHRPIAVNLNQQRIHILNQKHPQKGFDIKILDYNNPTGTEVIICIPINYET